MMTKNKNFANAVFNVSADVAGMTFVGLTCDSDVSHNACFCTGSLVHNCRVTKSYGGSGSVIQMESDNVHVKIQWHW